MSHGEQFRMNKTTAIQDYLNLFDPSEPSYGAIKRYTPFLHDLGQKYLRGKLLDIGAGSKNKEILLGHFVDSYIGLDHPITLHDSSQLDIFASAYNLPIQDSSFDSVLCTEVLEHLEEPSEAIQQAFRVLKSGGYAIYTAPLFWHVHEQPRDFYRYTAYGLAYLFEKNGFEVVGTYPLSGFWLTFGTGFNYYLQGYRRFWNALKIGWLIRLLTRFNNALMNWLDRGKLRQDRFTWLHIIVARKP